MTAPGGPLGRGLSGALRLDDFAAARISES
jgi:hypothetical protein